jgi:hypothetical protein
VSTFASGRTMWNSGAPVQNPGQGPVFRPAVQAVRARQSNQPFPKGRCYSTAAAAATAPPAPAAGPVFRQRTTPVRYALPPWQPRAGRTASNPGGPVRNPLRGPPVYAPQGPVRARQPLPPHGRGAGNPGTPPAAPVVIGPAFRQATQPARARIPRNGPRGRAASSPGAPVANPNVVLVFGATPGAVRASLPVSSRGRVTVRPQGAIAQPAAGPVFRQAAQPARARRPLQPLLRGRAASSPGAPVANPSHGPVFRQAASPARIRPSLPPKGRASGNRGAPVQNPSPGTSGPPVYGQIAGAAAVRWAGRSRAGSGASSLIRNPSQGPAFTQAAKALRAQLPSFPPPRGRVAASSVTAPVPVPPPVIPAPVYPLHGPVQARIPRPLLRGRAAGSLGGPVRNPASGPPVNTLGQPAGLLVSFIRTGHVSATATAPATPAPPPGTGPVFFPLRFPARARVPQNGPRGRCSSSPGAPARNPGNGPVFRQSPSPARGRLPLPPHGRTASNPGGPVRNPPPPILGPAFFPATSPARIRPALPPRGRVVSGRGAPVRNPGAGPAVYPSHGPVRAPVPQQFSKGRVASNPGAPVVFPIVPAPVYPLHGPVAARRPLPPRGRVITGNPGAPVRNPHQGGVFHSLPWPARSRIPQNAPRGRTASNPGGPVANIPFATLLFRLGSPYFQWETDTPGLTSEWSTGTPVFSWAAGVPETSA